MKAMWHLIENEVGKSCKGDKKIQLVSGTKIISDPQSVADMLNNFFVEILDELKVKTTIITKTQWQKQRINCCPNTIFFHPITEYEIVCVTNSLKGKLSAGYDEIPEYLVKKCINYVKRPLAHIFNASLSSGTFPDRLKLAKVIPLHKKGEYHDIKNYRLISILLAFSKILEKLMYDRLMLFLIQNNILTEAQNGFRKNKSTDTASQSFIESIPEALDNGLYAIGLFFDLSKAYDVIDHDILLEK
ncbi:hypothetical protein B7P43_G05448, partial [Cryptotermes secundus]